MGCPMIRWHVSPSATNDGLRRVTAPGDRHHREPVWDRNLVSSGSDSVLSFRSAARGNVPARGVALTVVGIAGR
jgi:hypothetical protein